MAGFSKLFVLLCSIQYSFQDCFEYGVDYLGNDISDGHYVSTSSAQGCQTECQHNSQCNFWTWDPTYHTACWMKTAKTQTTSNSAVVSGPKYCEGEQTTTDPNGSTDSMRVMSYNLYGWNALVQNPWKAENIYAAIRRSRPDILGAQECEGREWDVASNIGGDYSVAGEATAGHAILYRTSVLTFEGQGQMQLNEMDQWGPRTIEYAHFTHKLSGRQVDFFNTHLCLCNGDQLLGSAMTITDFMVQNRRPGSRIMLTGDFNCDDGYEQSKPVLYFKGQYGSSPILFDDTFRSYAGEGADGTTFPGKPGKIDYVMVDQGAGVENAWIDREARDASDHWPVSAVVSLL